MKIEKFKFWGETERKCIIASEGWTPLLLVTLKLKVLSLVRAGLGGVLQSRFLERVL